MTTKPPTILQIIPRLDTGGAELSTVEIAEAIVAAGGRALVLSEGGRLAARLAQAGAELVHFPAATKNPARMLANARRLVRLAGDEQVDLIHARSRAPAWSALIAARRLGRPFVTTYHGAYRESGPLKRLYNSVMARGDVAIANSRYTGDLIRVRYGIPAERICVIARGVDEERFHPNKIAPDRVARLRQSWGLGAGEPILLHAARLTGWKGQGVVIRAIGRLASAGQLGDAVAIFAGDAQGRDGYAQGLHELAQKLGVTGNVRFVGHVDDMPAAFIAARVAVIASTEPEAFGRTAAEAQAVGCPVIATDLGAPPETILAEPHTPLDDMTGWLVPPADDAALAERLRVALALSTPERAAIAVRARAHILARFTLTAMKVRTLEVYDALLGARLASRYLAAHASTTASAKA